MIEIIIVLAVIAVLGVILMPRLAINKATPGQINCINNLKQVSLGLLLWSDDNDDHLPSQILLRSNGVMELVEAGYIAPAFTVISNKLDTPKVLLCPEDRERKAATSFSKEFCESNISYFLGLDANKFAPQMFLAGDDNIKVLGKLAGRGRLDVTTNILVNWSDQRHMNRGNIALGDGSVQSFTTTALRTAIRNAGTNVIRLAFP